MWFSCLLCQLDADRVHTHPELLNVPSCPSVLTVSDASFRLQAGGQAAEALAGGMELLPVALVGLSVPESARGTVAVP